jgi:formiminoglutamase
MNQLIPADIHLPMTAEDDPRVGHLLGSSAIDNSARVVIIGFPTDKGVRRNGGRRGAAEGPTAIREELYRLTPDVENHDEFVDLLRSACDLGDVAVSRELEEDQARLGQVLAPHLGRGAIAIILGGGHETALGHFLGYVNAKKRIGILNWDAHADVRPIEDGQGHSGTTFRQALEHPSKLCGGYTVAGLNPPSFARAHLDYLNERRCGAHFNTSISFSAIESIYAACENDTMASFDIDAVDQASAPGVSAPATAGLSPHIWLHAAYRAGQCSTVRSMDLVEFSPPLDVDGRTARLAARTVWEFLRGLAAR